MGWRHLLCGKSTVWTHHNFRRSEGSSEAQPRYTYIHRVLAVPDQRGLGVATLDGVWRDWAFISSSTGNALFSNCMGKSKSINATAVADSVRGHLYLR